MSAMSQRSYILDNLTLVKCSERYLQIIDDTRKLSPMAYSASKLPAGP
jgi:hypothetical protein